MSSRLTLILTVMVLFSDLKANGQKHDYIWAFGDSCGLDFNTTDGEPVFFNSKIVTDECVGSFADTSGAIKFLFNGAGFSAIPAIFPPGARPLRSLPFFKDFIGETIPFLYPNPSIALNKDTYHTAVFINDSINESHSNGMLFLPHTTSLDTTFVICSMKAQGGTQPKGPWYSYFNIVKQPNGQHSVSGSIPLGGAKVFRKTCCNKTRK